MKKSKDANWPSGGVHLDFRIWSVSRVSSRGVRIILFVVKKGFQFVIGFVTKKTINSPGVRKNFQNEL